MQIDLFGSVADTQPIKQKKPKKRDVQAEARRLLDESGISALPRDVKEYVLAELISRWAPELKNVVMMAQIMNMHNQCSKEVTQ